MRRPFTVAPSSSIASTRLSTSTSTPNRSSDSRLVCDSSSGNVGSNRGPACTTMIRACAGSKRRKSFSMPQRASSAIAPASSTPVGPPPTMRNVSSLRRSAMSSVASARSNAISRRRRTSVASSTRLRPGANGAHSSRPK
jgi:hypothetical protein